MLFIVLKKKDLLLFASLVLAFCAYISLALLPTAVRSFSPQAVQGRVIVIDAGHGGEDGGAVSPDGVVESGINLAVAQELDAILTFLGEDTSMTRTEDVSIYSDGAETLHEKKVSDLKNRVALVNETPGALLLSIHQNSLPTAKSVRGAQAFYGRTDGSEPLAQSIQTALNRDINSADKEAKPILESVYLMKNVTAPAVLVECGFLSNREETKLLQQAEYQKKLAVVIAAGLLNTV